MTIDNLKELKALLTLCQKQGVTTIEIDNIKISLSSIPDRPKKQDFALELPPEANIAVPQYKPPEDKIVTESFDSLTDEQKLFYSSRPEATN